MRISPVDSWLERKLQPAGPLSVPIVREYQLRKLRETLERVLAHSRFYRQRLQGLDPGSIQTMEDVARLPFTHPGDLAAAPNDFLCVSPREVSRIVTLPTSGTTGRAKRIAFTPDDQELIVDFFHCGMTTLADETDRVIIFLPGRTEGSVGDLLLKALSRFGCRGIPYGPIEDYGAALKALAAIRPTCAAGIPSQFLGLARAADGQVRFKSVLLTTDYVPRAVVDSLTRDWGCEVFNHYGMTEMGLGGGVECSAHDGYHTRDADLLFEIVDPITGEPAPDGEYGEVVFSTLTRLGMPLIRYRTGDRSRLLAEPCRCGSLLKRLECISGRFAEPVQLSGGSRISITQLDEILFRDPGVRAYTAELCCRDNRDCLLLTVEAAAPAFDCDRLKHEICRKLAIGGLVESGELLLEVCEGEARHVTTGTAKRFIADRRGSRLSSMPGCPALPRTRESFEETTLSRM